MAGFKKGKGVKRARFEDANDSSSDAGGPSAKPVKKARTTAAASGKDDEGNSFWALSNTRRVGISNFKGKVMVNIREFYSDASGEMKPGRKGISLPLDQYASLLEAIPKLNAELIGLGHEIPQVKSTPLSQEKVASSDDDEDDASAVVKKKPVPASKKSKKSNIEATSDEEEEDDDAD